MRFLFYRYNNICEPDMIEALMELGHEVDTIDLEITVKEPDQKQIIDLVQNALFAKAYDGMVSVNFYPLISKLCNIFKLPYIAWTTDCPVDELGSQEIMNPVNRIYCFDYMQYEETRALCEAYEARAGVTDTQPRARIFYMPLATNVKRWDSVIAKASAADVDKYSGLVAFVGSLYTEKEYIFDRIPEFRDTAAERVETIRKLGDFLDKWSDARRFGEDSGIALGPDIGRTLDGDSSARHIFNLYTGSDCSQLPVNCRGIVKTHTQMPLVFHNSRINLNITCKPIRTGLAQRIWDVMGAGGFVLTNYQEELTEFFEPGVDLDFYRSIDELKEKVAYYLGHEDVRAAVALSGYEKVKAEHTFVHRMADILYLAFA